MTHLGRLHYLSKRPLRLVPVSYEWAFEGEAPDGIGLPQDETYQPQNFTQPISKRIHSPKKVLREYSRGRKEKNILAVGFDPRGKRLCEVNMTYDEWAAMDYDARKWALSNKATHPVAYFQWRYVE